jgi:hypothetical protein
MDETRRKKRPSRDDRPPTEGGKHPKKPPEKQLDSEDIERAVYDGMQDLRVERPKNR